MSEPAERAEDPDEDAELNDAIKDMEDDVQPVVDMTDAESAAGSGTEQLESTLGDWYGKPSKRRKT